MISLAVLDWHWCDFRLGTSISLEAGVLLIMDDLSGCTKHDIDVISAWTPLFTLAVLDMMTLM